MNRWLEKATDGSSDVLLSEQFNDNEKVGQLLCEILRHRVDGDDRAQLHKELEGELLKCGERVAEYLQENPEQYQIPAWAWAWAWEKAA